MGWRTIKADGEHFIPSDIFLSQTRFAVLPGRELEFERFWSARTQSSPIPGLLGSFLLRRDALKADDGFTYAASSLWTNPSAWSHGQHTQTATVEKELSSLLTQSPALLTLWEGKLTLASRAGLVPHLPAKLASH